MVTGLDVPLQFTLQRSNMKFLVKNTTSISQWQDYQELELIPYESDQGQRKYFASWLNSVWRPLLGLLMNELVAEQCVDYLNRCWSLNEANHGNCSTATSLQRFWDLIN